MDRTLFYTRHLFWVFFGKNIATCQKAKDYGLTFVKNICGDEINFANCRSCWKDRFGNFYNCDELNIQPLAQ